MTNVFVVRTLILISLVLSTCVPAIAQSQSSLVRTIWEQEHVRLLFGKDGSCRLVLNSGFEAIVPSKPFTFNAANDGTFSVQYSFTGVAIADEADFLFKYAKSDANRKGEILVTGTSVSEDGDWVSMEAHFVDRSDVLTLFMNLTGAFSVHYLGESKGAFILPQEAMLRFLRCANEIELEREQKKSDEAL